jgi:hypothetical protein
MEDNIMNINTMMNYMLRIMNNAIDYRNLIDVSYHNFDIDEHYYYTLINYDEVVNEVNGRPIYKDNYGNTVMITKEDEEMIRAYMIIAFVKEEGCCDESYSGMMLYLYNRFNQLTNNDIKRDTIKTIAQLQYKAILAGNFDKAKRLLTIIDIG